MFNKDNKPSRIISTSDYLKKKSQSLNLNYSPKKPSDLSIPDEVLIKVFDHLNLNDLFKCSLVNKQWYDISNLKRFWSKWTKLYKCQDEFNRIHDETNLSSKLCFKKLYEKKLDLAIFKLNQKVSKKFNKYTNLPDLLNLKSDLGSMIWSLKFYDKRDKELMKFTTQEQNNFEAGFSLVWSDLPDLNENLRNEIVKMKFNVNLPFYIDLKNGSLTNQKNKYSSDNLNKTCLIREYEFNFKNIQNSKLIYEDKLIQMYQYEQNFLFGLWKSNDKIKQLAFISVHLILDHDFLKIIFPSENKKTNLKKKEINYDTELDSKFGLHDYKVYLCIRNQTKTIFLSDVSTVYKASIEKYKENDYVYLDIYDCDMVKKVGPCLRMLPKFTWKSLINPKNNCDLLGIIDLCIFDSNNKLILSQSFPLNFFSKNSSQSETENFIVSHDLKTEYIDEKIIFKTSISTLKDEFSIKNDSDESYYLTSFKIYLSLDYVDQMLGTCFQKNKKK
ncbi:unnamed protein product [Brachionus calyciflorus]|uniref:F-box domain-containing protein n=1 Tax=Brachionus calyciflorus TaxID=104777 RepID=A0A813LZ64_9BILA|nr:unnamed protein product [Brachionus calyciflorus]